MTGHNIPPDDVTEHSGSRSADGQIRAAVAASFGSRATAALITLISSMVIARLLTPTETGVYAIGFGFATLLEMLREFGITGYLVQEQHLSGDKIRAAFSVSLLIGVAAGGLLIAVSQPVASYYGQRSLADVLSVLSISFFLLPFSAPSMALLRRELRFTALYRISACSTSQPALYRSRRH